MSDLRKYINIVESESLILKEGAIKNALLGAAAFGILLVGIGIGNSGGGQAVQSNAPAEITSPSSQVSHAQGEWQNALAILSSQLSGCENAIDVYVSTGEMVQDGDATVADFREESRLAAKSCRESAQYVAELKNEPAFDNPAHQAEWVKIVSASVESLLIAAKGLDASADLNIERSTTLLSKAKEKQKLCNRMILDFGSQIIHSGE